MEVQLTRSLPRAYSAVLLRQLRPTCLGMVPPTVGWTPLQKLRKCFTDLATGQSDTGNSLVVVPSSQEAPSLTVETIGIVDR